MRIIDLMLGKLRASIYVALGDSVASSGRLFVFKNEQIDMLNLKGMRFPVDVIRICRNTVAVLRFVDAN